MSVKEINDAMKEGNVVFGIRQCLKLGGGKKKPKKVFIVRDARPETVENLEKAKIKFEVLGNKKKEDVAKELDLDFESEVFSLK